MDSANRRMSRLTRRDLMRGAGLAAGAMAMPGLAACSDTSARTTEGYPIPTPDKPLTLPFFDDNPAIESGLEPENASVLKVLNYAEYLAPRVKKGFREKFGAEVQVTPYGDFEELQRQLMAPGAEYDVVFAGPTIMSRIVHSRLIRPFNQDYLPNLTNLWPEFQNPWYDQEARYSTPYNVYTYGIGYRADRVPEVPDNGYMMLWDPAYTGKIGIFDEPVDALSMAMVAWGITDNISTEDPAHINAARDKLIELLDLDVRLSINQYELLPSGRVTVHQCWSGDLTFADSYTTGDTTLEDLGYWQPEDRSQRIIGNETMSVPVSARNPVLGHEFINYLLDNDVAEENTRWTGYQPPISKLTPDYLIDEKVWPEQFRSTISVADDFAVGNQFTELEPRVENLWLRAWQEFLNG